MTRLADILRSKAAEIGAMDRDDVAQRARTSRHEPHDVVAALDQGALALIAEVKRRSPSAGALSTVLSPADRAVVYARSGASMVSVLCDGPFFDGSWEHLSAARARFDDAGLATPLLAKEFVIDDVQIAEARARGADAVLLIARIVDRATLRRLVASARDLGVEPLVEVALDAELDAALDAGARVIGVNARDLDTLAMDPARAARVLGNVPADRVAVHLSGLKGPEDVARIAASRADAALVGEALMRLDDPSALLGAMRAAAVQARGCARS